jgi:hypothetical protein|nr:MAG TPA: Poxvirus A28 family [Caudoviricetes sp.]
MNILSILLIIIFAASLIIIALELWSTTAVRKDSPPRFVDCGTGVRSGNKVYFKGLWIRPAFITPAYYNGDFQFLLANSSIQPIIFHAVRGDNRDGEGWLIYQVEYSTVLEMLKEANRIIDSSKQQSNERQ